MTTHEEDAEIERILNMSDEEIIAEAQREGRNPELEARYLQKLFENAVEIAKLRRLYASAVRGRALFRASYRKERTENTALRQAMALLNQEAPEPAPPPDPVPATVRLIGEHGEMRRALAGLRTAWDALCDCIDEFDPNDGEACGERRDALDTAILAVLAAHEAVNE